MADSFIKFITTVLKWKSSNHNHVSWEERFLNEIDSISTNQENSRFSLIAISTQETCGKFRERHTITIVSGQPAMLKAQTTKATPRVGFTSKWEDFPTEESPFQFIESISFSLWYCQLYSGQTSSYVPSSLQS